MDMDKELHSAAEKGDLDGFYKLALVKHNALQWDDNIVYTSTPCHVAARHGHLDFALEMLRLRPEFASTLDSKGLTPIQVAFDSGKVEMVLNLLNYDPEMVHVPSKQRKTILHSVSESEKHAHLLYRILSVACPNSVMDVTIRNETALHLAAKHRVFNNFNMLLSHLMKYGDKSKQARDLINSKDIDGNTVLHIAVRENQTQMVELLLKMSNIKANLTNNDNLAALYLLPSSCDFQLASILAAAKTTYGLSIPYINLDVRCTRFSHTMSWWHCIWLYLVHLCSTKSSPLLKRN
ncbi:hypothetical protein FNV43_RR02515 [Rhamnella rubrinervis]|uniref:Uncharacterized protein n=1 Tax=Rhamnella rubrinervis TaxID=2594499 RepID=A0A8K0HSB4_9ROSA|nr:hypothetical protein FNV43_RR02515 [Rhamnella rubrinervis]